MKQVLPYLLPLIVVVILGVLLISWYRRNTQTRLEPPTFAEGITIENITDFAERPSRTATSVQSRKFVNTDGQSALSALVRYESKDQSVAFTVELTGPAPEQGWYQVWIRSIDGSGIRKAFRLSMEEGGYVGSARMNQDILPVQLVITREVQEDDKLEQEVMSVRLRKTPSCQASTVC